MPWLHPSIVTITYFLDVCGTVYVDALIYLEDVNSIEYGDDAYVINSYRYMGVNLIYDRFCNCLVIAFNVKVIYLAEKIDQFSLEVTTIDTMLVSCGFESQIIDED